MAISRRDVLILTGAAIASVPLGSNATTATEASPSMPVAEGKPIPIEVISVNDFLHRDRHDKLYPDIRVYLDGDPKRIEPFLTCLEHKLTVQEICDALKLRFRGDVWFATLLVHLHIRDGLVSFPHLEVDPPAELLAKLEKLERDWQRRNEPPEPKLEMFGPPKPPPLPPVAFLEEEIAGIEALKERHPPLRLGLDKLLQRRREVLAKRMAVAARSSV